MDKAATTSKPKLTDFDLLDQEVQLKQAQHHPFTPGLGFGQHPTDVQTLQSSLDEGASSEKMEGLAPIVGVHLFGFEVRI